MLRKKEKDGKKQSLEEREKLKFDVRKMTLQGDKRRMKKEEEGVEKEIFSAGLSPSDPIDLLEEDSKILKGFLEYHQSNDAKLVEKIDLLLEATKKDTDLLTAIKEIGNGLLDLTKK